MNCEVIKVIESDTSTMPDLLRVIPYYAGKLIECVQKKDLAGAERVASIVWADCTNTTCGQDYYYEAMRFALRHFDKEAAEAVAEAISYSLGCLERQSIINIVNYLRSIK